MQLLFGKFIPIGSVNLVGVSFESNNVFQHLANGDVGQKLEQQFIFY